LVRYDDRGDQEEGQAMGLKLIDTVTFTSVRRPR
jgi:hypothetical protein